MYIISPAPQIIPPPCKKEASEISRRLPAPAYLLSYLQIEYMQLIKPLCFLCI